MKMFVGATLGAIVFPYIADRFGRKSCMIITLLAGKN